MGSKAMLGLTRRHQVGFNVRHMSVSRRQKVKKPAIAACDQKVRELREQGLSYPQIAELMGISVGTA